MNLLLQTYSYEDIMKLKYKTIQKNTESVSYYGYPGFQTIGTGIYQLRNGVKLRFSYIYEMKSEFSTNIKKVIQFEILNL